MLTEKKLQARLRELQAYRYRDPMTIDTWMFAEDEGHDPGARPAPTLYGRPMRLGEEWGGRDAYAWLSQSVAIPSDWEAKSIVGRFNFGSEPGHNSPFEAMLFVDQAPYQGVDANHGEVFLPKEAAGRTLLLQFRLWAGLRGPGQNRHRLHQAEIAWLDEEVDDLWFTAQAVWETVDALDAHQASRSPLLTALNLSFNLVDWQHPKSASFYQSLYHARSTLLASLAKIPWATPLTIKSVGHTHIDVAWLWRLKHTREKAARSFATVLRLMERFPDYIFFQSQPQLYEYVRQDYPELYQQIQARIAEGRWEADGAMWLEADCNIPSGESLVRQILFGTRFFRQQFGQTCRVLWLPDVFGYSWALPQILKKSGINSFCTTKISWNQFNRMPHDTFKWRGMDGSEVLAHFLTTPEVRDWRDPDHWFATYNGRITPGTVLGTWMRYQDKEINQDLLIAYGYGDGGGGVTREMLEMRRRLEAMPGLPQVKTGRVDQYFDKLHQTLQESQGYVHTWDGELYLEYHRGTYTSQAYQKRTNRRLELLYRQAEWLNVATSLLARRDPAASQETLNQGWKIILRNQFHDIIPGSSIREVYQDSRIEYQEAESIGSQVMNQALNPIRAKDTPPLSFTMLHSQAGPWAGVVHVATPEQGLTFVDAAGHELSSQAFDQGYLVQTTPFGGLGWTTIHARPTQSPVPDGPFQIGQGQLKTPHYLLEWDESGQWTRLYDVDHDREVLAPGTKGNVLQVFEDKPINFDAWDIDIFYQEKMKVIDRLERVETLSLGPVAAVLRFVWRYDQSLVQQDLMVYAQSRRIDLRTEVDWHQRQELLKVAFAVDVRSNQATYDMQFGNLKRPTHWNTSWDMAKFEVVGHQWADLSEMGYGVALANDCKYGYDIRDNVIRLSLIKSAIAPDEEADQGHHPFTYALIPHAGDFFAGQVAPLAWDLNCPIQAIPGSLAQPSFQLFDVIGEGVQVDAVKWSEEGKSAVIRVHEYSGGRRTVKFMSQLPIRTWHECNLMEDPEGYCPSNGPFQATLTAYEIKTFLVEFE